MTKKTWVEDNEDPKWKRRDRIATIIVQFVVAFVLVFAFMALRPAQAQSEPCGPQYSRPCIETDVPQVEEKQGKWSTNFRRCLIEKTGQQTISDYPMFDYAIAPEDIPDILKGIKELKKCAAFWQCVADRDAGKVKHCYENDRRWRQ